MLHSLAAHLCAEILELSLTQLEAIRLENYQTRKAWKAETKPALEPFFLFSVSF